MSYFQGGDFVELLSAQGKAPASTWKLQGKIIKSFDKAIKGNAFQMDGSSETKMQLPKTMTASSSSLGLTQRFLVLQLLVPHTRSFSVEIGFSDFQKIRRRLVFASAFREMAMTTLHVQIPISSIPRDQWMNFVFDLQALTEHFFPASSYRSVESICISGSCRLKRVFTMKDAPFCQALQDKQQTHLLQFRQQRIQSKDPTSVPITVASFAEMKEIPRQFVFTAAPSCLPIPTEYFLVSTERDTNQPPVNAVPSTTVGPLSKAPPSARAANTGDKRTITTSEKVKLKSTGVSTRGRSATNRKLAVEGPLVNEGRPLSAVPSRVPTTQLEEASESIVRSNMEPKRLGTSPAADPGFLPPRFSSCPDRISRDIATNRRPSLPRTPQLPSTSSIDSAEENATEHDEVVLDGSRIWDRQSPAHHGHSDPHHGHDATAASKRKQHRQHVLSEIQLKLEELTTEAHDEEERSRELFLSRTSLGSEITGSLEPEGHELEHLVNPTPRQVSEKCALQSKVHSAQSSSSLDDWHDSEMLRSPEPMVLRRACATKKQSDIVFSSSIFFHRSDSSPAALPDQHIDESTSQIKRLFDWDSLLEESVGSLPGHQKTASTESAGSAKNQTSLRARVDASENSPELFVKRSVNLSASDRTISTKPFSRSIVGSKDADVVRYLNDKRPDLVDAASQLAEEERMEALTAESRWERIDAAQHFVQEGDEEEGDDLLQSSFDFSLSPVISDPVIPESECVDTLKLQQNTGGFPPVADSEAFSLDLTDRVRNLRLEEDVAASPADKDNDGRSGPPSDNLDDDEESFDFDDLVVRDRDSSPATRTSQQLRDTSVEQTAKETRNRKETKPPKASQPEAKTSRSHQNPSKPNQTRQERIATSGTRQTVKDSHPSNSRSPLHSTRLCDESRPLVRAPSLPSRAMSSSDRRLASLLDSTDWSQLPLSSTVTSPVQPTKSSITTEHPRAKTARDSSPTKGGTSSSLELIYDPILRCYYDPVGKKYYTLAK